MLSISTISQWWLLVVWAISVYLAYTYFKQKLSNSKVKNPSNHSFFTCIKNTIEFKLPTIKLYYHDKFAKGRTKIFQDMLAIKLKIWAEKLREATNKEWDLNTIYQNTLINIYRWYLSERKEREIPLVVVEKFNKRHEPLIELYQKSIENICSSKWYSSRIEKENAILEISNAMVVFTILDWEKTLGSLNWELTGLKYKWLLII